MTQRIIYKNAAGGVSIIIPSQEAVAKYGIAAIAAKDVPAGMPYKIVDTSDVPTDREYRALWVVDEAMLTDGVGSDSNEFQ